MAETHEGFITLNNGEADAMAPYRRVKIDGSDPTKVLYADASDGDSWIGTTEPMPGGDPANGEPVTIRLRGESRTVKVCVTEAVEVGDSLYPENDGKVSDTAGSVVVGTALSAAGGSGGIVEMLPNAGSGSAPDEEAIAPADGTTGAGIPIMLTRFGLATAATTHEIKKPARKLRIMRAWAVLRDGTTDSDILLKVGASSICAAKSFTATDELLDFSITDTVTEIAAASTIYASIATAATAPGFDVYILALPVP